MTAPLESRGPVVSTTIAVSPLLATVTVASFSGFVAYISAMKNAPVNVAA